MNIIILIFYSFSIIAVFCNCGEMVVNAFDDELCRWEWHLFSMEFQRMLIVAIANAQRPVFIRGYCNIQCTRNSFKKVSKVAAWALLIFWLFFLHSNLDDQNKFLLLCNTSSHWWSNGRIGGSCPNKNDMIRMVLDQLYDWPFSSSMHEYHKKLLKIQSAMKIPISFVWQWRRLQRNSFTCNFWQYVST